MYNKKEKASLPVEQQRFWATDVNRKWTFCIIGQWFGSNSRGNPHYKRKETWQNKFVRVKVYIFSEKASLPVDERRPKTSLLKTPG